jgi:hypothetical protein
MSDLIRAWGTYVYLGPSAVSEAEAVELKKSNLPLTIEEIEEVISFLDESSDPIVKSSISSTKKPQGFNTKDKVTDRQPGNIPGTKAQGNKPKAPASGDGDKADPSANTVASENTTDVYYVSKKDYPKRPNGCIGETPHSWKVPSGAMASLDAQQGNDLKDPEAAKDEQQAPTDYVAYSKIPKSREILEGHLTAGKIADVAALGVQGATDSIKIVIQGNGAGVMKPNVESLYIQKLITSKSEPTDKQGWTFNKTSKQWERISGEQYDIKSPSAMGTFGSGTIPFNRNVQRETSAYSVSNLLGIAAVPVTVKRMHEGKPHSVQDFKPNCKSLWSYMQETQDLKDQNVTAKDALMKFAGDKWPELEQEMKDYAVFDIIINNQDRHPANFILDPDAKSIHLIDHGFTFGNSMHGSRNYFLQQVFHGNERITMSPKLMRSIKNKSYQDFKKSMTDMYDWEAGQAFLRSRYVVEMQEQLGFIDKKKFLPIILSNDGKAMEPTDAKPWSFGGGSSKAKRMFDLLVMKSERELPADVFNSWAKGYLLKASQDPEHPDHIDAKELLNVGCFMDVGFTSYETGVEGYRLDGLHKEFFDAIEPNYELKASSEDFDDDETVPDKHHVNQEGATVAATRPSSARKTA